jgi:CHAT domain-containing protein/tetratricopeptide (TPR) repeat protein
LASYAQQFIDASHAKLRVDLPAALKFSELAITTARHLQDDRLTGIAFRSKGNATYLLGDNQAAINLHEQAMEIFRRLCESLEIARTASASVQPLILMGEYPRALRAANLARRIFQKLGDHRRLAFAEINVGNLYHRQDRFRLALACYERGYQTLASLGDSEQQAIALNNISVCHISLNDFQGALATYERARNLCLRAGLKLLLTQTDYNIAYLYYIRGEYGRAIELLRAVRQQSQQSKDLHIESLSFLNLSEIYLELNLSSEAIECAETAARGFRDLGMRYETGKALTNQAIGLGQKGGSSEAIALFSEARSIFLLENNVTWPPLVDLYRALLLFNEGRFTEALALAVGALAIFEDSVLTGKEILCRLLLGRIEMQQGRPEAARLHTETAIARLSVLELPILEFQASLLLGQIYSREGQHSAAYKAFQAARRSLEGLRASLHKDELKLAFLKHKHEAYDQLVLMCLNQSAPEATPGKAFEFIELAKSRALMDLIQQNQRARGPRVARKADADAKLRNLRNEIDWHYRRIEIEQLRGDASNPSYLQRLRSEASELESSYLRKFRDRPESRSKQITATDSAVVDVVSMQAELGTTSSMLQYFVVGETIVASVIDNEQVHLCTVSTRARIERLLSGLQLQMSKFRLGQDYLQQFQQQLLESAQGHLRDLYNELLAPLRPFLRRQHLVIVPHGILHHLPFHALDDGESYVLDRFTISYAPSASVYRLCCKKRISNSRRSLALGISDAAAPLIRDEVRAISKVLPSPQVYLNRRATEQILREVGPKCRIVHIATHGNFRQDNPAFSTIKLGRSYLSLCDLDELKLPVDLLTLSGCGTGLNVIHAGDEQVGLMRGFLGAGARSLLLTLWDVNDRSTSVFMTSFYSALQKGPSKAHAFRCATNETRRLFPHPYFWAPFILVGAAF